MKLVDLLYSVTTGPERRRRLLTPVGLAFAIGLLVAVVLGGLFTDRALSLPPLLPQVLGAGLGALLLTAGLALWVWCLVLFKGKGVPVNPPRELVVVGVYAWVRNPMLTGLCTALFGLGFILNSVSMVFMWAPAFVALNLIELKLVEEPELERRFGADFNEYKHRVPRFVPRKPRNSGSGAPPKRPPLAAHPGVGPTLEGWREMARTVLITGASSGIGRVTAELMAQRGWQVAATSRDLAGLRAWAPEANVAVFPLDVTDEASIAAAVSGVVDRFGGIDVLVNNAGIGLFGPLEAATPDQVEAQFRTNVFGSIALIRHVMPIMRSRRSGAIINVSSIGGRTAAPFASLYHATKFAIEGLSESFRYEASLHGIRVKVVEPSHFRTGFISRSVVLSGHSAYDTQLRNYLEWVHEEDQKAPAPRPVAEAILRAAEDPSARLRYPVKGALVLALTSFLPDALWRSLLGAGMTRRPKSSLTRSGGSGPTSG